MQFASGEAPHRAKSSANPITGDKTLRNTRALAAAALLLLLAGCGASAEERAAAAEASQEAAASASASASASAAAEAKAEREAREAAEAEAAWEACDEATSGLHEALSEINSRLSIGMNYSEFGDRVGDAQVAYDNTDFTAMDGKCSLNVGIALEDGLNQYIKSLNKWQKCIEDYNCRVEGKVLQRLRNHWREGTERLDHVDESLETADAYGALDDWP